MLLLVGCLLPRAEGTHTPLPRAETGDTAAGRSEDDLAADDARVRALTGLPEGQAPCAPPVLVRVDYTVDGDTFYATAEESGELMNVRIIGVNAPEIAHESGETSDCYGNEAWTFSATELEGRLAWLTSDAECLDAYDRTLAYVIRGEGETGFHNRRLVRGGYATAFEVDPNDTYADDFDQDEDEARQEGRGLWSACTR